MTQTAVSQTPAGAHPGGLHLYCERSGHAQASTAPLILLHGGFSAGREISAVDLQGHGRTADIDRPSSFKAMADDVATLIRPLGLPRADALGYSLGGGVAAQTAIQYPALLRTLVAVSAPLRRNAWYASSRTGMDQMSDQTAASMLNTPYKLYAHTAPRPGNWARLWGKVGELLRREYDWSADIAAPRVSTLMAFGDADSFAPTHAAEFFALLGGSVHDGGWDQSGMTPHRLANLLAATPNDIFQPPLLPRSS